MVEYRKFDYFKTPIESISGFSNFVNPEKYKTNDLEVFHYLYNMEIDRKNWGIMWNRYKDWSVIFLVIFSLLLPIIAYLMIILSCKMLSLYEVNIIDRKIISYFIIYQTIITEFSMWYKLRFIDLYNKYIERKYKKRSQFNRLIEEYLEVVNYHYWMKKVLYK